MSELNIETEILKIIPFEEELNGAIGRVDLLIRLKFGEYKILGTSEITIFYKDANISLENLLTESRLAALSVLKRTLGLLESQEIPEDLSQRWL